MTNTVTIENLTKYPDRVTVDDKSPSYGDKYLIVAGDTKVVLSEELLLKMRRESASMDQVTLALNIDDETRNELVRQIHSLQLKPLRRADREGNVWYTLY